MTNHTGYLKIINNGEIEIGALTMIGATNKRGDSNKIGFFGSGLKYAMAVMLRNKIPFHIFSGEKEIKVGVKNKIFRGKEVEVITVNGKETSFTTDMGPTWEPWFCVRELYCNALDEGDTTIDVAGETEGYKDKTAIYIGFTPEIKKVVDSWDLYFSNKRKDIVSTGLLNTFMGGDQLIVYRKGIRAYYGTYRKCLYHYDLEDIKINESRVVDSHFDMEWKIATLLKNHATKEIARTILENGNNDTLFETTLEWQAGYGFNPSWLEAIDGRILVPRESAGLYYEELTGKELIIPSELVKELKKFFPEVKIMGRHEDGITFHEKTSTEISKINECIEILKKVDINIPYEIEVCHFEDQNILGSIFNSRKQILIARKTFLLGKRTLLSTVIEEYSHLDSSAGDKTRKFQDYLINIFINQIEKQVGENI